MSCIETHIHIHTPYNLSKYSLLIAMYSKNKSKNKITDHLTHIS